MIALFPAIRMLRVPCMLGVTFLALGCDNRQAFQEPDWTWSRMLAQRRADPYAASSAFADGKVMREPPRGTVARDFDDELAAPPPAFTRELLALGRRRYETTCATCHGILGDGVSVVATKMRVRPPPSLHESRLREASNERLFAVVTGGYGLMPSYADMLHADERWAIVGYVRALQLSLHADAADLPPDVRAQLAKEAP